MEHIHHHIEWRCSMLNKKGVTLIEVIISIALVSVVLVFMFKLVIELNNAQTNTTYAKENQMVRVEILRAINNDIISKTLTGIDDSGSTSSNLVIKFTFSDSSTSTIQASSTEFSYISSSGVTRTWDMVDCTIYTRSATVYFAKDANIYAFNIDIEIHTENESNNASSNNTLDDISISIIGDANNLNIYYLDCLGYSC